MKSFFEYLKALFTQWYVYIVFIPEFLDFISAYFPEKYHFQIPVFYTWLFLVIVFVYANFKIWKKALYKNKSPKVIIDYDLSSFNIVYLEIKNIGNDYAKNIKITFDPDLKDKGEKINDKKFLKNIPLLEPISLNQNKKIRFFFGTFLEEKYLQKFNVKISYSDIDGKNKFSENQIIDLSSFIGTSPQKPENEIVNELKNISKHLKENKDNSKKAIETLKNGINIRNSNLNHFSFDEIKFLLKNIFEHGNKEDLWLNPYIYDTRQIIKLFREKMLAKKDLEDNDKKILEQINVLHKYQFHCGSNDEFDNAIQELNKLIK
jgi:hypothetical protein